MIAESREQEFALCMLDPCQPDALRKHIPSPPGCGSSISICCLTVCSASRCSGWAGADHRSVAGRGRSAGSARWIPAPWQSGGLQADQHSLAKALQDVFNDYPEYAALYPGGGLGGCRLGRPALAGGAAHPGGAEAVAGGGQGQPARPLPLLSGLLVASH